MSDQSPREANRAAKHGHAEVSNYDIVSHYFGLAAERLGLRDDVGAVLRLLLPRGPGPDPDPDVGRQDPRLLRLSASSTTARAARTRAASASTPRSTSTRYGRSPR